MNRSSLIAPALAALGVLAPACSSPADPSPPAPTPRVAAAPGPAAPAGTADPAPPPEALRELRRGHVTEISAPASREAPPRPPHGVRLELVRYRAPLGENHAYVTPERPGERRPAIVWVHGGFDWGIDDFAWARAPRANDQSARAFRDAGLVQMYPSLRGSHDNPGHNECFFGEVDDILAAAEHLASRSDVDASRIYLGGHSTGATLALLAAESSDRFRGVIAFGPVDDPRAYGDMGCLPPELSGREARVRSPLAFVDQIRTPTFVIEGEHGNVESARVLGAYRGRAPVQVLIVPGADHFDVLAPGTEAAAEAILADAGAPIGPALTVETIVSRMHR